MAERFHGNTAARVSLAGAILVVVIADLITLPTLPGARSGQPDSTAPSSAIPSAAEPSAPGASTRDGAPELFPAGPPSAVRVPTGASRPTPTATPPRTHPRGHAPEPSRPRASHSPFEQRCRDGEIAAWLCGPIPN